jgi:hypothetical protein
MWKKAAMACLRHYSSMCGWTEENHENLKQNCQYLGRDPSLKPPENKTGLLIKNFNYKITRN